MEPWVIAGLVAGGALLGGLLTAAYLVRKMRGKVQYMMDALEDRETNFRFDDRKPGFRKYHRALNRIRFLFEREKNEVAEREHFYGAILDRVSTAVMVMDLSPRQQGGVLYCNKAALNTLGVATLSNVRQLGVISDELVNLLLAPDEAQEQRCSYFNERGKITLSLCAVEARLQQKDVKIVMFSDVTRNLVHNEELSWNKLIRVLTHEIMNTVTPIASLSRALSEELDKGMEENEDCQVMKEGLDTIFTSAEGLIRFVNSYRSLTRVAAPQKKPFYLYELIDTVKCLTARQVEEAGAALEYREQTDDILLYADTGQLSQVFVNLVRNALQAGATLIRITAAIDFAEAVVVQVFNNGRPIEKDNQEEIFVPFYTTKPEGTGIGLSLSRQIMRQHNGNLCLERSDGSGTVFRLVFH